MDIQVAGGDYTKISRESLPQSGLTTAWSSKCINGIYSRPSGAPGIPRMTAAFCAPGGFLRGIAADDGRRRPRPLLVLGSQELRYTDACLLGLPDS